LTAGTVPGASPKLAEPVFMPADWAPAQESLATVSRGRRDESLDLLRGLAIVILVVNHVHLDSALGHLTGAALSAAEVLVSVSGVVVGMVFGRRWLIKGPRATTAMLLRRSRKLYLASVAVVALVGALTLVPGPATDALTVSPNMHPARDLYAFDGAPQIALAIVSLKAGPWQFSILGLFIALLAAAPAILWALHRGWWPAVLLLSWGLFALGREWTIDLLPAQSERPFPVLVWQVLFVNGLVVGWHRDRIAAWLSRHRRLVSLVVVGLAGGFVTLQVAGPAVAEAEAWARWEAEHFDKGSLDIARVLAMVSIAGALYLALRTYPALMRRALDALLLPLGRNSFYVFIMHVFVCLAVASMPVLAGRGVGLIGNTLVEVGCVALLWIMVKRRILFRWGTPRLRNRHAGRAHRPALAQVTLGAHDLAVPDPDDRRPGAVEGNPGRPEAAHESLRGEDPFRVDLEHLVELEPEVVECLREVLPPAVQPGVAVVVGLDDPAGRVVYLDAGVPDTALVLAAEQVLEGPPHDLEVVAGHRVRDYPGPASPGGPRRPPAVRAAGANCGDKGVGFDEFLSFHGG
jgi:hypothetical protein